MTDYAPMCVIRAMLLAALVAFLWAAQMHDGERPDVTTEAGARIDDNGAK